MLPKKIPHIAVPHGIIGRCMKEHPRTYGSHSNIMSHHLPHRENPYRFVSKRFDITMRNRVTDSNSHSFSSRLRALRSNGTPEIILGTSILVVAGIDYALQQRDDTSRQQMMLQLEAEVNDDAEMSRREIERKKNATVLFQCVVRRVPPNFDGHRCLTEVKVGDVLHVVEEGVGPGNQYNLCSFDRGAGIISVGWFPCSCLEPVSSQLTSHKNN